MIPVLGTVAASYEIESFPDSSGSEDYVPTDRGDLGEVSLEDLFALEVRGESMIGAGIKDGSFIIMQHTRTAENGDICALLIDGRETTLKYFYREDKGITLKAANPQFEEKFYDSSHKVEIQGKLVLVVQ